MNYKEKTIVFCDFDGTVTKEDTFFGAVSRLVDPVHLALCSEQLKGGKASLYACSQELISTIPSSKRSDILEYGRSVPVREGFLSFLEYCRSSNIPVVIISGGIRWMQEELLKPYMPYIAGFHSCDIDTSGEFMHFFSDHTDGSECMLKTEIMDLYCHEKSIVIGDGFADLTMARRADIVFARGDLAAILDRENRPYYLWENFDDILKQIISLASI